MLAGDVGYILGVCIIAVPLGSLLMLIEALAAVMVIFISEVLKYHVEERVGS